MIEALKLIDMIERADNADYWYDDRREIASDIFKKLNHEELHFLLNNWHEQSDEWKRRFATILNMRETIETATTLTKIMQSEIYNTAVTAMYELGDFEDIGIIRKIEGLKKILHDFDDRFGSQSNYRLHYSGVLSQLAENAN